MKLTSVCALIACLALTPVGRVSAQDLSDLVIPSREELDEALVSGEIDPEQYRALLELIEQPVDTVRLHLLDLVPNLSYLGNVSDSSASLLEQDQRNPYIESAGSARHLNWRHRIARAMSEDGVTRYDSDIALHPQDNWQVQLGTRRDKTGIESITRRAITYAAKDHLIREFALGSFSRRLGLGAAIGYRGRIVDPPDGNELESWVSPYNGSANGLYCRLRPGAWSTAVYLSDHRNSDYRLNTVAWSVERDLERDRTKVGLTLVKTRLTRRSSRTLLGDTKVSLQASHSYRHGRIEVETVFQTDDSSGFSVVVLEGHHRHKTASVRYAAWCYRDRYLDLAGGSKSIGLNRTLRIEGDSLSFSSRRSGQSGGLVRTIVPIHNKVRLISSILTGWINRDTTALQAMTAVEYRPSGTMSFRADVLLRTSHRVMLSDTRDRDYRKVRLELRHRGGTLDGRASVAHISEQDSPDLVQVFVTGKYREHHRGEWQVWSDWRWHRLTRAPRRWYGFLLHRRQLSATLNLTVKISHRYYSGEESAHETTASMELRLSL